ncbi:MAG: glycosyltransferase family 2 protein [Polyangiaceae bacterium]
MQPAGRLLSIVVPVYNEGASIGRLLDRIVEHLHIPFEILVVYDFDEDNTLPALREYAGPKLDVRLVKNRARGALRAIETGLLEAKGIATVVMMADLSDDLRIVDEMFRLVEQEGYAVVCGSRYMKGGRQIGGPFIKGQISRAVGKSLHLLTAIPTHDITNSFKMYRRDVIERFPIESNGGFELGMELTTKAYLAGMKVCEIPSTWTDRTDGKSRFKLVRWAPKYLRWYFHLLQGAVKNGSALRGALG